MVPENRVKCFVGDYLAGHRSIYFKPLRSFSPVGDRHGRKHLRVVTTAANFSGIVIGRNKGVLGIEEVVVDSGEVVERNAGFGEKDESFIREVEKGVG